jgi:hypothetical protein
MVTVSATYLILNNQGQQPSRQAGSFLRSPKACRRLAEGEALKSFYSFLGIIHTNVEPVIAPYNKEPREKTIITAKTEF